MAPYAAEYCWTRSGWKPTNKVVHLNAGLLPGLFFLVNFCTVAANYFGNFQIFRVNSKKIAKLSKPTKLAKRKPWLPLLLSLLFISCQIFCKYIKTHSLCQIRWRGCPKVRVQ
jgi:hypothetical protein